MKNTDPSREAPVKTTEPLALDLLLTEDQRRSVTVADHEHFIRSISTDERGVDAIDRAVDDELIDELAVVDPYECHAPSRRSDKEVANLLDLLDNLETGNDRKETTR